jgi:hypothetical protein
LLPNSSVSSVTASVHSSAARSRSE